MPPAEPEYTAVVKGISADMWSAEIKSQHMNYALRALLFIAGFLAVILAFLVFLVR